MVEVVCVRVLHLALAEHRSQCALGHADRRPAAAHSIPEAIAGVARLTFRVAWQWQHIERLPKEHLDDRLPAHVQLRSGTVQLVEHVRGEMDVDPLGKQAACVNEQGDLRVYAKELEDGSKADGWRLPCGGLRPQP
jgi:hypothetical protein